MRCRFDVGERAIGKTQGVVDPTEHPQRDGILYIRYPGINASVNTADLFEVIRTTMR
jgi:hypothetical protein